MPAYSGCPGKKTVKLVSCVLELLLCVNFEAKTSQHFECYLLLLLSFLNFTLQIIFRVKCYVV